MEGREMRKGRLSLYEPAIYNIKVVGHLDINKAMWFEGMTLTNIFEEDGTPVTLMNGLVADQAMLHSLLSSIRDLGLPLLSILFVDSPNK
jgi:hypothetical protein